MCRSIKPLRPPFVSDPTDEEIEAAARQYVRKIAGTRKPSKLDEAAFVAAIGEVAEATRRLLGGLVIGRR